MWYYVDAKLVICVIILRCTALNRIDAEGVVSTQNVFKAQYLRFVAVLRTYGEVGYTRLMIIISTMSIFLNSALFVGLRHMNSDDNVYQLKSKDFFSQPMTFDVIFQTITKKARLRIFNTFIEHVMGSLQESSVLFDVINISSFVVFLLALGWVLQRFVSFRFALISLFAISALFPLHFFYTIPQSYPVEFIWTLGCLCLAVGTLDHGLQSGSRRWQALGLAFFFLSLNGQEYQLILCPLVAIVAVGYRTITEGKPIPWRVVIAGGVVYGLFVGMFLANYLYHRSMLAEGYQHLVVSFDGVAWGTTLLKLYRTSILAVGLGEGIRLMSAFPQNGISFPAEFTYERFFMGPQDWASMALVFACASVCWYLMLTRIVLKNAQLILVATVGFLFVFVPTAVVSVSKLHQKLIPNNFVNGHITSFHVHIGITLLLLATAIWAMQMRKPLVLQVMLVVCLVGGAAAYQTVVFRYNTSNRQLMNYAMQRWDAIRLLGLYHDAEPGLMRDISYASSTLQTRLGVAGAPSSGKGKPIYWTKYAQAVVGIPVAFYYEKPSSSPSYPRFEYATGERGEPLVFVLDRCSDASCVEVVTLSTEPIAATLHVSTRTTEKLTASSWECATVCIVRRKISYEDVLIVPYVDRPVETPTLFRQLIGAVRGEFSPGFGMIDQPHSR